MKLIRKLSIGPNYKEAMHYSLTQKVHENHIIESIKEDTEGYHIYIQKGDIIVPWKFFNKSMAISIEYSIEY